jgi:uncharacterized protein YbaP (TraB family)
MIKTNKKNNSLLWQIKNKEHNYYSFIYGTIHLRDKKVYFLIDEIKKYIEKSDFFIAEYNLDDNRQDEIMSAMQMPEGKHLRNYFSDKKFVKAQKIIQKSFGFDIEKLGFLKPIALENMFTEMSFNSDFSLPLDFELWNYAKNLGKNLNGAESIESQIKILKKLSLKQQIKSFKQIIRNVEKYRNKLNRITKYYVNQDITMLYRLSVKTLGTSKNILVYKRNEKICEKIIEIHKKGSVFAAIGAGHLWGEKGILRILKTKGYEIKPVRV